MTISGFAVDLLVYDRNRRRYAEDKLPRNDLSPVWRPTKDIETKRGETTSGIELCHYAKFHADRSHRRRDI